jgi:type II secretory ATPase GspE/PulE/Tfp pilus assembly ATPase PilB-like protein
MQEQDIITYLRYAQEAGIPFSERLELFMPLNAEPLLSALLAKQKGALVLSWDDQRAKVAFSNPFFHELMQEISVLIRRKIDPILTTQEALNLALEKAYGPKASMPAFLQTQEKKGDAVDEVYLISDDHTRWDVIGYLDHILIQSLNKAASDIHFDPVETGLVIRMRIDGAMSFSDEVPKEFSKQLVARLKVLAKLDIAEMRLPQDGRIKARYAFKNFDMRISTLPTIYGERVVLRVLGGQALNDGLQESGMPEDVLAGLRRAMRLSQGLILVTGPTGSGKTSTLYAALKELDSRTINIMTIEDPVELKIPHVTQVAVNTKIGLTFEKGLRHLLRQDPDVMMIGEIRDRETAEIAVQAALTGHLVVSTLHTNDAASAVTRLVDMGVAPFLINSCLTGVLAQRLVRKLCPHCKKIAAIDQEEKMLLGLMESVQVAQPQGCQECFHLGYKGRTGIFEWLPMTGAIRELVLKNSDSQTIQKAAENEGMRTLRKAGRQAVISQMTSAAEVLKVVS